MPTSSRFGRYEVEEEVARGGMGVIYRVRDPEMRRFLAMKVLLSPGDEQGDKLSARFQDEAQLTGQLDHPGIIPVYDMGRGEDGRLYFTMRLVKGRTLEEVFELVREGKEGWTNTRALGVLQKVCEAMAFAHERGVIHRDLKPSNVMVGRFGETYVMDWGLAKLVDEDETPEPAHDSSVHTVLTSARKEDSDGSSELETLEGDVMGTPAYMAPEQARGKVGRVGTRADVYSVGAMLYDLLAGHPPYRPPGVKVSAREVLERLLDGPPAPIEQEAHDAPPELCAICERAMERSAERRYATMMEVADDLQAFVEHRVVQAYRRGALIEFRKWVERNRGTAASLALALVLAFVGLVAVSLIQTRSVQAVELANKELEGANEALETANVEIRAARDEARANEELAVRNEREARWQGYVANIAAASASLETGAAASAREQLAACPEDLRGWEWTFLQRQSDASTAVLDDGETFVGRVVFSPDGTLLATAPWSYSSMGSGEYRVRLWNVATGELVHALEPHKERVFDIAFSPSGTELVAADEDEVRVFDVASGEIVQRRSVWTDRVEAAGDPKPCLAYLPDGLHVAVEWSTNELVVWNLIEDTIEIVDHAESAEEPGQYRALALSPDGRLAVSAGRRRVRVVDLADGATVLDLDVLDEARWHPDTVVVSDVQFDPDGARLVCALSSGDVRVLDMAEGRFVLDFKAHTSTNAARFSPNGLWIATAGTDRTVRLWHAETGRPLETLLGHNANVIHVAFSPGGDRIATGAWETAARLWDGQPGSTVTRLSGRGGDTLASAKIAFDASGERFAWASKDGNRIRITDTRTGQDLVTLPDNYRDVHDLAFTPEGDVLATSSWNEVRLWDTETGELLATSRELNRSHFGTFDSEGRRVVTLEEQEEHAHNSKEEKAYEVRIYDVLTGDELNAWEHPGDSHALDLSQNGLLVTAARADANVRIWDVNSGALLREIDVEQRVSRVSFSEAGDRLVATLVGEEKHAVLVIDVDSGKVTRLEGHAKPWGAVWHPDGSRFVTSNWDNTLSVWDPERGEIFGFRAHERAYPMKAEFSRDGRLLGDVAAGGEHTIWDTTPLASRAALRRVAASERLIEKRVAPLVAALFEDLYTPPQAVERIALRMDLDDDERRVATRLARVRGFVPGDVIYDAWIRLCEAGRTPDEYLRLLGLFELCLARDRPAHLPANPRYVTGLGAAQYRMGRYEDALVTLERARTLHDEKEVAFGLWRDTLFLAMTLVRIGRIAEAEDIVEENRFYLRITQRSLTDAGRLSLVGSRTLLGEATAALESAR